MSKDQFITMTLYKNTETGTLQPYGHYGKDSETEDEEIECHVGFHVTPGEPRTHWEPGCPAEVEVDDVTLVSDGSEVEDYDDQLIADWITEWVDGV